MAATLTVFLILNTFELLPSSVQNLTNPLLRHTGLATQAILYQQVLDLGQTPPVLEAKQVLLNPRRVLSQLCTQLGIGFDEKMLHWQPGARPEDGIWAKHWYQNVHKSTGFEQYRAKNEPFPPRLLRLLAECKPFYDLLAEKAIRADG